MAKIGRPGLSRKKRIELWERWKRGQCASDIAQAIGHLRARRRMRYPKGGTTPSRLPGQIIDAISIRERPAEIEDRAIPGH
jgi:hypothetical protein